MKRWRVGIHPNLKIFFDVDHLQGLRWICHNAAPALRLVSWPWVTRDPSSPTRDWTRTPRIGRWSLNHWTTREVPSEFKTDILLKTGKRRTVKPHNCEKMPANYISNNGLLTTMWKKLSKFSKNTNNPSKEWTKDSSRHFATKDVQLKSRHVRIPSWSIRKCKLNHSEVAHLSAQL